MKNTILTLLFFGFCFLATSQNTPQVGDELLIKAPTAQSFNYVNFPKANILIKRGVVTRYKSVYDNTVVIESVTTKDNRTTDVVLRKKDGSKFFGFLSKVKANYSRAIDAGELAVAR